MLMLMIFYAAVNSEWTGSVSKVSVEKFVNSSMLQGENEFHLKDQFSYFGMTDQCFRPELCLTGANALWNLASLQWADG